MMAPALAAHLQPPRLRRQLAVAQRQVLRQVVIKRVPSRLPLEREHEGRIGVDIDRLDRIHLNADG
jgi:hypothetical protein